MNETAIIIATSGHIDHGKTALIEALTGINCDRLPEEKKRGMTIELGFAHMSLDDGRTVSIVDVPGHEKFIRHMAAGAAGVDAALLVIAADEGIMPQTREHLAIMQLLGIHDGITVITKTDKVYPSVSPLKLGGDGRAAALLEDVKELTRNTFLEGRPVISVSAVTGKNLDLLRREIQNLADRAKPRDPSGDFFMPLDRVFSIAGFGTVATGTVYHGSISTNDTAEILPSGHTGRIRGIQIHSRTVHTARAGQRAALNIAGVPAGEISRGEVICSGEFRPVKRLNVSVKILPGVRTPLKHMQRVHVHIGTSEILARVSLRGMKQIEPGNEGNARLILEAPAVCMDGQRFILRFYSPLITIGGGQVIFPETPKPEEESAPAQNKNFYAIPEDSFSAHKNTLRKICLSHKWRLVTRNELQQESTLPAKIFASVFRAMENSGELALLPEGLVLVNELEEELVNILRGIDGIITPASIRDILNTSRKYIVPVLEYLDRKGITRREENGRVMR